MAVAPSELCLGGGRAGLQGGKSPTAEALLGMAVLGTTWKGNGQGTSWGRRDSEGIYAHV